MAPVWQPPTATIGSKIVWWGITSASGRNTQSEPQDAAAGRMEMRPTTRCRTRAASSAVTNPFPVTSQATSCSGVSVRIPTAA
jgi:hypothetical protein